MANIDTEILNWIALAKGDVDGHEFHGNQYATAHGVPHGADPKGHVARAAELAHRGKVNWDEGGVRRSEHIQHADDHAALAKEHEKLAAQAKAEGNVDGETAHNIAARNHWFSAESHGSVHDGDQGTASYAEKDSKQAAGATRWAMSVYDPSSKVTKGDEEGHVFHGNQWSQGTGGGGHTPPPRREMPERFPHRTGNEEPPKFGGNRWNGEPEIAPKPLPSAEPDPSLHTWQPPTPESWTSAHGEPNDHEFKGNTYLPADHPLGPWTK
jgi:hypothetical protein